MVRSSPPKEVLMHLQNKKNSIQLMIVSSIFLLFRALRIVGMGTSSKAPSISKKKLQEQFPYEVFSKIEEKQYKAASVDPADFISF